MDYLIFHDCVHVYIKQLFDINLVLTPKKSIFYHLFGFLGVLFSRRELLSVNFLFSWFRSDG